MGIFWDLIKTLFLDLFLWLQKLKLEVFMAWEDLCFLLLWFCFPTREYSITWQDACFYGFVYSCTVHNRVLITKMTPTKLLKNILDESSRLKNMSNKRLGCLMKSLLSQDFYWTMSDLSKTLISHSDYDPKLALGKFESWKL